MAKRPPRPGSNTARCTVCNHPSRAEIDRALINGVPLRTLAATHSLSSSALFRHTRHIREQLVVEQRQAEQSQVSQFLENLELLEFRLNRLYHKAEESHSLYISLGCLQESLRILSLKEKIRRSQAGRIYGKI
jgi:hypothetical protein